MDYLSKEQIEARRPYPTPPPGVDPRERLCKRLQDAGQWYPRQRAGRDFGIACVSLEISQRCNLDCTLCYLSEASEAVKDIPLEEVFRRIDMIRDHYGEETNIQVSGGDPTVRKREELVAIVKYITSKNLHSSLFTNGILARRDLLKELRSVGLTDVAFHVDITQQRKGYDSEDKLNELRQTYIDSALGLGLGIFFNCTVCAGNLQQIPDVVRFYVKNAKHINMVSFQLQADTGRGVLRERDFRITQDSVCEQISKGAGCHLDFDALQFGHTSCNKYAMSLVANGEVFDALDDAEWALLLTNTLDSLKRPFNRAERWRGILNVSGQLMMRPRFILRTLPYLWRKLIQMGPSLLKNRGRFHAMAFFLHNFMDAEKLECDRIDSCVFMVATADGPMSMCLHNAKRDEYLLRPIEVTAKDDVTQKAWWNPLTGKTQMQPPGKLDVRHTRKTARGLAKVRLDTDRLKQTVRTTGDSP